jgi:hypothetical protein
MQTRMCFLETGQITADQEAHIDKLAANHGLTGANACLVAADMNSGIAAPSVAVASLPIMLQY